MIVKKMRVFSFLFIITSTIFIFKCQFLDNKGRNYKLNTSNPGKLKEFQCFFSEHGLELEVSKVDLDEVDADPLTVIVHKASQMDEGILVEDTSLDVEGADIGVNVRWLIEDLEQYLGRKAIWTVLLAHRLKNEVYVYKGEIIGQIVRPVNMNNGFGFDPYFLPEGATKTLSEEKLSHVNARALAVENFINKKPFVISDPIYNWDGKWQEHD